jgi:hypothetical protein
LSVAKKNEGAEDAPAPPEKPVAKATEPEELATAPTPIEESTATEAPTGKCAAITAPSEAAPAGTAPASTKVEPSKEPAVFVFKHPAGAGQSASEIKKVTFDPSTWSSGGTQSFAFVSEETSRLVEAVQAKPTAAVSEPGDEVVGSKHVEGITPAVPSKGDIKVSITSDAARTVGSEPKSNEDTHYKREELNASSEVTSVNTDALATEDEPAFPEPGIIEDTQSEASEAPLQVPSSTVATQEDSASPISSIASDGDEYQDLVAKLEALQSSIAMLQKVGLNDEAVPLSQKANEIKQKITKFAPQAEQAAAEETTEASGIGTVPEKQEQDQSDDMGEVALEQGSFGDREVKKLLEVQRDCAPADEQDSSVEYDAETLESLAYFDIEFANDQLQI